MNNLSSSVNSFDWRRSKVQELASQGYNQSEISRILQISQPKREKIQALSLAKECYSMKLDLLTNATVVDDAIRFVSSNKDKKSVLDNERQEDEIGEITTATTNQVF
jgi:hypothetical protein